VGHYTPANTFAASATDQYGPLIMVSGVGGVGGDFSQTGQVGCM